MIDNSACFMSIGFVTKNLNNLLSWLKTPKHFLVVGGVIIALLLVGYFIRQSNQSHVLSEEGRPTVNINRSYQVIARTLEKQRTTGRFALTVTNAQFADYILVQGKRAKPIEGKTFLLINMEIENKHNVELYAFPVDLFRFIREDGKRFAPSVHQGAVLVRPQATKKSNVAFVASPTDKKFKIEVGDINNPKETLEVTFK